MVTPIVRPHLFVLSVLIACGLAAGLWWVAPGPSARAASAVSASEEARAAAAPSVLVVRRAGDHDALWLLSPADGTPTAAGDLPGMAGDVAVSPDGLSAAYLPENGAPRLWIGTGPLAPRTISLTGAGVRRVHSLTWVDDGRLMVAGATRASAGSSGDRLYLVNAATGKVRAFRDLRGTEPSAAPAAGKVAYVRLTTVVPGTSEEQPHTDGQGEPQDPEPDGQRQRAHRLGGAVPGPRRVPRVLTAAGLAGWLVVPDRDYRERRAGDVRDPRPQRHPVADALHPRDPGRCGVGRVGSPDGVRRRHRRDQ